jgi:hypothetical protein
MPGTLLLIFILIVSLNVSAQVKKTKDIFTASVYYHYGVVLPHHRTIKELTKDQIYGLEINFGLLPSNGRSWVASYKRPEIGFGLYHTSLGNKEVFGKATALYPYINFPLYDSPKLDFYLKIGMGLAYTRKKFDETKNNANVAIGSHINAFFKLMSGAHFSISPKVAINSGIGFSHLSNGAIKLPNKGLNMLTTNIGIKYYLNDRKPLTYVPPINKGKLDNEISFILSGGVKELENKNRYYTTSLSCNYGIGINAKQRLGLGVDFFYDESKNKENTDSNDNTNFEDQFSQAITFTHDFVIQRFSIIANIGVYTWYRTKPERPIYSRVGLRYQISDHIIGNISLKAHVGRADFIEWGIGYKIKTKSSTR